MREVLDHVAHRMGELPDFVSCVRNQGIRQVASGNSLRPFQQIGNPHAGPPRHIEGHAQKHGAPQDVDGKGYLQIAVGCGDEVFAAGGNVLDGVSRQGLHGNLDTGEMLTFHLGQ